MMNKEKVFFLPGPLHLFWATGYYYLCELVKDNMVVMLVDGSYSSSSKFKRIIESIDVETVVYIPTEISFIKKNKYYVTEFRRLIRQYKPTVIMQHSFFYIEDMYMFHWAKRELDNCKLISFQNARFPSSPKEDFIGKRASVVSAFLNIHKWVPLSVARMYIQLKYFIKFYLEYKVLPLFFLRVVFKPIINVYAGGGIKNNVLSIDEYLYYMDMELPLIVNFFGTSNVYKKIEHPIKKSNNESKLLLLGENYKEVNRIIILPSYGHIDIKIMNGEEFDHIVEDISKKWISIIDRLQKRYIDYELCLKLHPLSVNDKCWHKIAQKLQAVYKINIIDPSESAEDWILKSKIIVGDVSSVLWWASLIENKVIYTLDVFGYVGGADAKYLPGIKYIKNISSI